MSRQPEPLFLARQSYRSRRLGDAARVLPIVGIVLLLLPILWAETARTREGLIYIFVVWALLIFVAGPISALLPTHSEGRGDIPGDDPGEGV